MRKLVLMLLLAACGETVPGESPDMRMMAECPAGVDAPQAVRCNVGSDTSCHAPLSGVPQGQVCRCLCNGYWECDLIAVLCDGGVRD